jgi:hypothetical protein
MTSSGAGDSPETGSAGLRLLLSRGPVRHIPSPLDMPLGRAPKPGEATRGIRQGVPSSSKDLVNANGPNTGSAKLRERGLAISRFNFRTKRWERIELETEEFREGTYRVERAGASQ